MQAIFPPFIEVREGNEVGDGKGSHFAFSQSINFQKVLKSHKIKIKAF